MSARRDSESVAKELLRSLRAATSCVVGQRLEAPSGTYTIGHDQTAAFYRPASLRASAGGPSGLFFDLTYIFAIVVGTSIDFRPSSQVETRMYQYRLLDHDHRELLVYHWQPGARFAGPDHPHLHISAALDAQVDALSRREIHLDKRHLVTGQVSLPAVVRMLITDLEVVPLRHDWRTILDRTEATLRALAGQ